ncbi:unnamed protein product [Colias eurytheme]|nr:unnamed protein product [Colias eurytheme]
MRKNTPRCDAVWELKTQFRLVQVSLKNLSRSRGDFGTGNTIDDEKKCGIKARVHGTISSRVTATLAAARVCARGAAKLGEHAAMLAVAICCILVLLLVFIILIIVVGQNMEGKTGS